MIMKNKYYVGERVDGGVIYSIVQGGYEKVRTLSLIEEDEDYEHPWDAKFPGWYKKPVYYILLDVPKVPLTFEEYKEQMPSIKEEFLEERYSKIPKVIRTSIPEDGVILDETLDELMEKLVETDDV